VYDSYNKGKFMGEEIVKPANSTYWIITNGTSYGDGVTGIDQVTTVGNGWTIYWQGTNYEEYIIQCQNVNIVPKISLQ
jgi:hypothetical protein